MSKEKPEVGDVWQYKNGMKFYILKETTSNSMPFGEDIKYSAFEVIEEDGELNLHDEIPFINGTFEYLGKSNDLTQDWRDGKGIFHHRNSGYVYVKDTLENEVIESLAALYQAPFSLRESKISKGYKILAEVPDYNLWQNMCNINNMEHEANNKLREDVERLEKENKELKRQVNHLSKTQARQFVDNQKLQVKVQKAKDVIDIATARKIMRLEREVNRLSKDMYFIASNGNPDFDAKKSAQKAWDAISTKHLNGELK